MYVAITRAKKRLYLTYASRRMLHGRIGSSRRSSFINEIPSATLRFVNEAEDSGEDDYVQRDYRRYSADRGEDRWYKSDVEKTRRYSTNVPSWAEKIFKPTKEEKKQENNLRQKSKFFESVFSRRKSNA